ncbi:MAG TPA: heavy metal sensor histidine kinase [Polyangiales bacterium]|nr:heavy metal sensor histidine kinase [Polyangiales bacterium]
MSRSIATRLAGLFAGAGLLVFSLNAAALHHVLRSEINRHQYLQLDTKLRLMQHVIGRCATPDKWEGVRNKFDSLTPGDGSTQFWVISSDPHYTYGSPSPLLLERMQGPTGALDMQLEPGRTYKTLLGAVEANHERPAVRLLVASDVALYSQTLKSFRTALVLLSAAGVLLVALLGYYIAKVGLRPLRQLSAGAQALHPRNLAQRLTLSPLPGELADLKNSFNGALDRVEAAYQQLEAFNADVAHELRTPLTNLIGQTQVALARERSAAELCEVLQSNLEELERLRVIVNDMLFLASADQGAKAQERQASSLAGEVAKTVEFLEYIFDEARVTVRVEGDARGLIERSLFRRALTNLLHNAVQHSAPGSEVVVVIADHGGSVRVAVENPGAAFSNEHAERLFDRFYRLDSARRNSGENHGLGLSIVKAVAKMHGGTVFAKSERGWNTVGFTVLSG